MVAAQLTMVKAGRDWEWSPRATAKLVPKLAALVADDER